MRISEDLVVQNVGGEKLVLVDDSTGSEATWLVGTHADVQAFAKELDGYSMQLGGWREIEADEGPTIRLNGAELARFAFAAGFLIGGAS